MSTIAPVSDVPPSVGQRTQEPVGGADPAVATYREGMTHLEPSLRQRVTQARVARLATVLPGGGPHIVPITFAVDGDTIVTAVDHKPKTTMSLQRLKNIEANPMASVIVDHYDDDWSQLWWVRADGVAAIHQSGEEMAAGYALLRRKYLQYQRIALDGPVVTVDVQKWSSWQA
jgi:PPOX class probable F420-dependent enzyme